MARVVRGLIVALGLAVFVEAPEARQAPQTWAVSDVLSRAADYVETYANSMTRMVVEESYVQDVQTANRSSPRLNLTRRPVHRTLKSDLLLVRPEGASTWMQFRDVFEVDGRPVRDRNDRLAKLFLQPSQSTSAQAAKIAAESARYNIGDIERTINVPVLALTLLAGDAQPGFEFQTNGPEGMPTDLPDAETFVPPAGAFVLGFREIAVRTLITSPQGRNMAARGRFWVSMPSGQVRMTELRVQDSALSAAIHVAYEPRPGFSVPVPIAMHELYVNRLNLSRVEGSATYTNFREFKVKTDEAIAPPPTPGR